MMKRLCLLAFVAGLALSASAQEPLSGVLHPYPSEPGVQTPAPCGYKPFYISHYGRHGSRYLSSEKQILPAYEGLTACEKAGILNNKGYKLLDMVKEVRRESEGLWGELSELGQKEHREIAARMVHNFPEVLRDSIHASSSVYSRCIVSMAVSVGEIQRLSPSAKINFKVGKRYQRILNTRQRLPGKRESGTSLQRKYLSENLSAERLLDAIVTDRQKALSLIGNPESFFKAVYLAWADRDAIGLSAFDLRSILGEAAVQCLACSENLNLYQTLAIPCADTLLSDIIWRADAAIAVGKPLADLRYGHDSDLMKFMVRTGFEGYVSGLEAEQAALFDFSEKVPLATNVQMVFYRGRKGKPILVKILLNENEAKLEGIAGGPYYPWETVKQAWLQR